MPRPLFSVRFPAALTEALDHCAEDRQWSRSDLVEKIIAALTSDHREEIVRTLVLGPATEKLNLRLSPEARAHLTELAGDLAPAEFLRRAVANILADGLDEDDGSSQPEAAPYGRDAHLGLLWLFVLALGAAVAALVWLLLRFAPGPSKPDRGPGSVPPTPESGPRGQLPEDLEP